MEERTSSCRIRLNYGRENIIMKNEAELWKEEAELWKKEHHHVELD